MVVVVGKLNALLLLQMEEEEEEKVEVLMLRLMLAVVTTATCDAVIREVVGVMLIAPLEFLTKSNRSVVVVVVELVLVLGLKALLVLLLLLALVLLINVGVGVGVDSDGNDDNDDDDSDVVFAVKVELTYVVDPVAFVCLLFVIRLAGLILMEVWLWEVVANFGAILTN